ncbi:tetratricopeptide repeat protein [Actinoplanes sp. NPDC023801]|uniref:tetratricopeptide repeat protein n=1 Tax=Actinoplanes sp. NPDC023801 TaxID=3154595 RepID=UPI003410F67A
MTGEQRSVVVNGDVSGIVSTGDNAVNVQYRVDRIDVNLPPELDAPEVVQAPAGLINLPLRPGLFVGRDHELARLDRMPMASGRVVVQTVHGLGGIGKSTLVAHWAARRRDSFAPIWWITADSPAALEAGLVALAVALQPSAAAVLQSAELAERAIRWLASHRGWLLILDNVNQPEDIAGLTGRFPAGRIVVTSRRATGWDDALRLDVLGPGEAVGLLTGILGDAACPEAETVCAELGRLPLAIEQAGAYMVQTGTSARVYLRLLAEHPGRMYGESEEGRAAERTVARIWRVTLDHLADEPLAGQVLRLLAWLGPEAVPRSLLNLLGDEPAVIRATGRLAAYGMVALTGDTVTMHRLLQAVSRTPDPDDPHRQPADIVAAHDAAAAALAEALPGDDDLPEHWPAWRALLPHIDALTSRRPPDGATREALGYAAGLCGHAGNFVQGQGDVVRATRYHERAVAELTALFGARDETTLAMAGNLAGAYLEAGDLGRAVPLFERVLADTRRTRGRKDPDTLRAMNNLAGAYRAAGDFARAAKLQEKVLAIRRRSGGTDLKALLSVNNTALTYLDAGDPHRAVPMFEQALAGLREALGADHPQTLVTASNLAMALGRSGRRDRALPLLEQVLATRRRVLGEDHPSTLNSANSLAVAYQESGDTARALTLFERVLGERRRVLGDDHPETLGTRHSIASVWFMAGDAGRALPMLEELVADRRRLLGEHHPGTLRTMSALVAACNAAGDRGRGIALGEQALGAQRRVLGDEHPDTVNTIVNLAIGYAAAGDSARAIALGEQALVAQRRVFGDDHPQTRATVWFLERTRQEG